jgi:ferritin-like metal-binding protein YciE
LLRENNLKSSAESTTTSGPSKATGPLGCASDHLYASDIHQPRRIEMSVDTIDGLFVEELNDLYSAENQITKALPKLIKAATSKELRSAFEHHLEETEGHVQRLEQVFEILGSRPKGKTCDGMKGVLEEGSELLHETAEGNVRDAALISAAQRVEHYEMAVYGTVRSFAENLGHSKISEILQKTLQEEKAADKKLTEISQKVNRHMQQAV